MPAPADPELQNVYATKFVDDFLMLSTQRGSKLRNLINEEPDSIDAKRAIFDRMGHFDPVRRTALHQETPIQHLPFSRRVAILDDWTWATLMDPTALERMMKNPQNRAVTSAVYALGRKVDDIIIAAAVGNAAAMAADESLSNVALPAAQVLGDGTAPFSLAAWLNIKERFDTNDVDEAEQRNLVVAAAQLRTLLDDPKITSADYNTVRALVDGKVDQFLGFNVVRTQRLPKAATVRTVLAFTNEAIGFCTGDDILRRMTERDDLNYSMQMWMQMGIAAVRLEEERVVTFRALEP